MRVSARREWLVPLLLAAATAGGCGLSGDAPGGGAFRDCDTCPLMISLPPGRFRMGSAEGERLVDPRTGRPAANDVPAHPVTIDGPLALGKYEVSVAEFGEFVRSTGHRTSGGCMEFSKPDAISISEGHDWDRPGFVQTSEHPVTCVSFADAQAYAQWLSQRTGQPYRLPSEAEWEYAARAGTSGPYHWGHDSARACDFANIRSAGAYTLSRAQAASDRADGFSCDDGAVHSAPVGSYAPNAFGLFDMQGNVWEWVADCNHKDYVGAPADGRPWLDDLGCQFGVIRSGSYLNRVERSSTTVRAGRPRSGRATNMGFRVARGPVPGGAPGNTPASAQAATPRVGEQADIGADGPGGRLFAENCAPCHIASNSFRGIYGREEAALVKTIRDGGNNVMSMPAFGEQLSDLEIRELAGYLREQNGW